VGDIANQLQQQVEAAIADHRPLCIVGGNSKASYGRLPQGEPLSILAHSGITQYNPTELVLTARAGTSLEEIEHTLAMNNQMLAFEPPAFGPAATLGGVVACNLSGPRRAYQGAARDYVLGTRIINGKAEQLQFGGEVMKNVAGYDVSRLMCGALGTLGILLEISLKVLPKPATEVTLTQSISQAKAIEQLNQWASMPLPISASAWVDEQLYIRLSGPDSALTTAQRYLGGELLDRHDEFWRQLKEQTHPFFNATDKTCWRLSVPPTTPPLTTNGSTLLEWGGGQRWILNNETPEVMFEQARAVGAQATCFAGGDRAHFFQPLSTGLQGLHQRIKQAFDPHHIFNPGRMYPEL
jgi:glycolate oxidase FAD binding subunit